MSGSPQHHDSEAAGVPRTKMHSIRSHSPPCSVRLRNQECMNHQPASLSPDSTGRWTMTRLDDFLDQSSNVACTHSCIMTRIAILQIELRRLCAQDEMTLHSMEFCK